MPHVPQDLQGLIERGAIYECAAYFQGASEADRQALARTAEKSLRDLTKVGVNADTEAARQHRGRQEAARLAALAACSLSTLKALAWRIHPLDADAVRVLADRKPDWLPEFAEYLLEGPHVAWASVRLLMRAGLIGKPAHDNYVLGMTHLFGGVGGRSSAPSDDERDQWTVLAHLESEPDLLEDIWRLFELEGDGEYSLAAHDKFSRLPADRWDGSLAELSNRGLLSRDRLLDASLAALNRGFSQFRVAWFAAFHELLKPTDQERRTRLDQYLTLLASPIPPTVSFALEVVETIDRQQPLPARALVEALRPFMLGRAKGTVKSGLKLLGRVVERDPAESALVARTAAQALVHEASDVQAAAMSLVAACGDPADAALVDAVRRARDLVAASVRKEVQDWLGSAGAASDGVKQKDAAKVPVKSRGAKPQARHTSGDDFDRRAACLPAEWRARSGLDAVLAALRSGQLNLSPAEFDGTEFPRLDPSRSLTAIQSIDELIDHAAALVESPADADSIELLYDGISRMCDQRPDDFGQRSGPLLKRIRDLVKRKGIIPFTGHDPAADLIGVVLAWLTGDYGSLEPTRLHGQPAVRFRLGENENSFPVPNRNVIGGSLALRSRQLSDRVIQRMATGTLCAPTHAGGWIDPRVLVERANDRRLVDLATDIEQVLALLRLAPDRRDVALTRLAPSKAEFVTALRYALGAAVKQAGPSNWLWVAAARSRSPFADDPLVERAHPGLGPDAGTAARGTAVVKQEKYQSYKFHRLAVNVQPALPKSIDPRLLTVLAWKHADRLGPEFVSATAVSERFHIWPLAQEAAFAAGAVALGNNLDWSEAEWHNRGYLQPLLDPDVPLGPMALLVLVLGLAAKEPGEHGVATDVAIAAIDDGRLDGIRLGAALAELLPTGLIKAARWARTLGHVSQSSELHAEVVRTAIAHALRGKPSAMPKDLHALVELLKELVISTETAIDEPARQFLQTITGGGKLASAAGKILAATSRERPDRVAGIQRSVVERRLARLERWRKLWEGAP